MASQKQVSANKANAQKSTGPKSVKGKASVAKNAIRHGILSTQLFLSGEDPAEYNVLLDELMAALCPVGILEQMLVEKVAVAAWKQRRLIAAETAAIELNRTLLRPENRLAVGEAMGLVFPAPEVSTEELEPIPDEARQHLNLCHQVVAEFKALDEDVLDSITLEALPKCAPVMFAYLKAYAKQELLSVAAYLEGHEDGLIQWVYEFYDQCEKAILSMSRKQLVQLTAQMVSTAKTVLFDNELLSRYQTALDSELYRAVNALRKQQEWRLKMMTDVQVGPNTAVQTL